MTTQCFTLIQKNVNIRPDLLTPKLSGEDRDPEKEKRRGALLWLIVVAAGYAADEREYDAAGNKCMLHAWKSGGCGSYLLFGMSARP